MPHEPVRTAPELRRPTTRALVPMACGAVAAIAVLYLLVPRLAGLDGTWAPARRRPGLARRRRAARDRLLRRYAALFRLVTGVDRRTSLSITLAGVAATRLVAAAGAGGIALTAWALRRSGMSPRDVATRLSTFYVLLYAVFMAPLVMGGAGLRAGWFPGPAPSAFTVVTAAFCDAGGLRARLAALLASVDGDTAALEPAAAEARAMVEHEPVPEWLDAAIRDGGARRRR